MTPDDELVDSAVRGDRAAFAMMVERHRAGMRAAAIALLGYTDEADDAVQDAVVVALRHRAAADNSPATDAETAALYGAIANVTETSRDVLTKMYEIGSSEPFYRTSRLGRLFRDGMAAAQAANLNPKHFGIPGRVALDQPAEFPFG